MTVGHTSTALAERPDALLDEDDLRSLLDTCRYAVRRAATTDTPVLATWAVPVEVDDPAALWARGRGTATRSLLWRSAWGGGTVVALASRRRLAQSGADRVAAVRRGWAALSRHAVAGGLPGGGPLALGGFAFAAGAPAAPGPLPDALFWVPALQLRTAADGSGELRLNAVLGRDGDAGRTADALARLADLVHPRDLGAVPAAPAPRPAAHLRSSTELPGAEEWKGLVRRATDRISAGDFAKVVLARELHVTVDAPFDVPAVVERMRRANPGATLFAVDHDGQTFLGATPEYLARVVGRTVHALGLAGTTPRGDTPAQDAEFERELTGSHKLRHEHDVVVRMLRDSLHAAGVEVAAAQPTRVLKLGTVQHLSTDVSGRLSHTDPAGILDFVERLHPTPALGGHPRERALHWLAEHEGFDRGWYAGVVGWSDAGGQGEFAVAIRSALLRGNTAVLYAGCGLVADSDPETEYVETRAKLRAMMSALEVE